MDREFNCARFQAFKQRVTHGARMRMTRAAAGAHNVYV